MKRDEIKTLIELSTSFEKADAILEKYTTYRSDEERIAYLQGLFDCEVVGRTVSDVHTDYVALLTAIVDKKWRG